MNTEIKKEDNLQIAAPLTFGQKAVGLTFNPRKDNDVDMCKKRFADAIDHLHTVRRDTPDPQTGRLASIAITEIETACMWAVKTLTWRYNQA